MSGQMLTFVMLVLQSWIYGSVALNVCSASDPALTSSITLPFFLNPTHSSFPFSYLFFFFLLLYTKIREQDLLLAVNNKIRNVVSSCFGCASSRFTFFYDNMYRFPYLFILRSSYRVLRKGFQTPTSDTTEFNSDRWASFF